MFGGECRGVLWCVVVCCAVLWCVVVCCGVLWCAVVCGGVALCCGVLLLIKKVPMKIGAGLSLLIDICTAVFCGAVRCFAVCCGVMWSFWVCCGVLWCVVVRCVMLRSVDTDGYICRSVLQCVRQFSVDFF